MQALSGRPREQPCGKNPALIPVDRLHVAIIGGGPKSEVSTVRLVPAQLLASPDVGGDKCGAAEQVVSEVVGLLVKAEVPVDVGVEVDGLAAEDKDLADTEVVSGVSRHRLERDVLTRDAAAAFEDVVNGVPVGGQLHLAADGVVGDDGGGVLVGGGVPNSGLDGVVAASGHGVVRYEKVESE